MSASDQPPLLFRATQGGMEVALEDADGNLLSHTMGFEGAFDFLRAFGDQLNQQYRSEMGDDAKASVSKLHILTEAVEIGGGLYGEPGNQEVAMYLGSQDFASVVTKLPREALVETIAALQLILDTPDTILSQRRDN